MLKRPILTTALLALPLTLALNADPAAADSRKHGDYEHGTLLYAGGPPPWAPAHGYRAKHGHKHKYKRSYKHDHVYDLETATLPDVHVAPFDIGIGTCDREAIGRLLGGAAGALAGAQVGKGKGKLAAVAGGTVLGFIIGGSIGRSMDRVDQSCIGQVMEHASDGQRVAWHNPDTQARYNVVPTGTVQHAGGNYCREYTASATIDGRPQRTHGTACRDADGRWRLVN